MWRCHVTGQTGPSSKYPVPYSNILHSDLADFTKFAPISKTEDHFKFVEEEWNKYFQNYVQNKDNIKKFSDQYWGYSGKNLSGVGMEQFVIGILHASLRLLITSFARSMTLILEVGNVNNALKILSTHHVRAQMGFTNGIPMATFNNHDSDNVPLVMIAVCEELDETRKQAMVAFWCQVQEVMHTLYTTWPTEKQIDDFAYHIQILGRFFKVLFGDTSITPTMRILVDQAPYFLKRLGSLAVFSEEPCECEHSFQNLLYHSGTRGGLKGGVLQCLTSILATEYHHKFTCEQYSPLDSISRVKQLKRTQNRILNKQSKQKNNVLNTHLK